MKFLVSHQGEQSGPFTLDEIVARVRGKELDLFDYIYDEEKADWVLLMEFAALASRLKSNKPTARPPAGNAGNFTAETPAHDEGAKTETRAAAPATVATAKTTSASASATASAVTATESASPHAVTEWFVVKGENRFGPFAYQDVVRMLQQKVVFPFDFIWHAGLPAWKRIAELSEFSADNIRSLLAQQDSAFVQRRFQRQKYTGKVLVHDNATLWKGQGFEISKGGVGVALSNALVLPGQQVTVHFSAHEGWPAFNALCEVVAKKFVNDASPIEYGLRFLSLSQDVQEQLFKKAA